MTNKEKIHRLSSPDDQDTLKKVKERIRNRSQLRRSRKIALLVLNRIDELGWNQTQLADKMGVSKQQVSKIVSGNENLTLKTLEQLHEILDIAIFADQVKEKSTIKVLKLQMDTTTIPKPSKPITVYPKWGSNKILEPMVVRESPVPYHQIPREA